MELVPREESGISQIPMGPFQSIVLDLAITFLYKSIVCGPISTPCQESGMPSVVVFVLPRERFLKSKASQMRLSTGRRSSTPRSLAFWIASLATWSLSGSTRELPTEWPRASLKV